MRLKTKYEVGEIPHSEYPRPQMRRNSYLCLNGIWKFEKAPKDEQVDALTRDILVPFSPESLNSGVEEGFVLNATEKLVYEKEFFVGDEMFLGVTLLHFGAVDQECEVFLNDRIVYAHTSGFIPFTVDITGALVKGKNILRVECTDETEKNELTRGKQSTKPGTIWYTAQSGIWQSVWLESVPENYIRELIVKTNTETREVTIFSDYDGKQSLRVYDGETLLLTKEFTEKTVTIQADFELWCPENPKLYDFVLTTDSGDEVFSYFGVRSLGVGKDENGRARLLLNGKPYFMNGILDQGYWSDGLLTPPSDKAMLEELTMLKEMGFNMVRKHIKIEPLRWYYHCDRLGLLVWQDFVNGGGEYKFSHVAVFPFLGFKHRDDDYAYFARKSKRARYEFLHAVEDTIRALRNSPSICTWVIFNEGWGQFDSAKVTSFVEDLDDTRLIDSVSGWHDQGVEKTTMRSMHTYYTPLRVPRDSRPVVLSEFGGYSLKVKDHVFNEEKEFGYKVFKTEEELLAALRKLYLEKLKPLIAKGLCAAVYTQVSDVEEEINGLVTYDREKCKIPVKEMRKILDEINEESKKFQ